MRLRGRPADASRGATVGMKMNPRVQLLKELVNDELYVIDDVAVADAILLRSMTRHMLPDVAFRGTPRPEPEVRSFRPHRGAKSFRLTRAERGGCIAALAPARDRLIRAAPTCTCAERHREIHFPAILTRKLRK